MYCEYPECDEPAACMVYWPDRKPVPFCHEHVDLCDVVAKKEGVTVRVTPLDE